MSAHEQFADDLALLALGTLQGDERVALEKHLEGCPACRRESPRRVRFVVDFIYVIQSLGNV
jgi:anti-sigma factor RsiW